MKKMLSTRIAILLGVFLLTGVLPGAALGAGTNPVKVYYQDEAVAEGLDFSGEVAVPAASLRKLGLEVQVSPQNQVYIRQQNQDQALLMSPSSNQGQRYQGQTSQSVNLNLAPYVKGKEVYVPLKDVAQAFSLSWRQEGTAVYVSAPRTQVTAKPTVPQPGWSASQQIQRYQVVKNNRSAAQLNLILNGSADKVKTTVKTVKLKTGYQVEVTVSGAKLSNSLADRLQDGQTLGKKQWFLNSFRAVNTTSGTKIILNVDSKPEVKVSRQNQTLQLKFS
jgi:hypothetical protein